MDHPGGRCGRDGYRVPGGSDFRTACFYDQCATDQDCPNGSACECGGGPDTIATVNRCLAGNCRVDADCGDGQLCTPSRIGCTEYTEGYFCTTPRDECTVDTNGNGCSFVGDHWVPLDDGCEAI